jgi:hypothetical protein
VTTSQPDPEQQVRRDFAEMLILEGRLAEAGLGSAHPADTDILVELGERMLARLEADQ